MTPEERDLITQFVARVGGSRQSGGFLSSSVPNTQPALPPIDREADEFLAEQFRQYPEARYRITQTAVVQEAALAEAQNRIQRLQWEVDQARQAMQQMQQQGAAPGQSGQSGNKGFFGNLFGGGSQPQPPQRPQGNPWGQQGGQPGGYPQQGGYQPTSAPPQPQYPPNYQPGMFQRGGGSGFLGSALTTAAGVAGGMVVGNALMNAFSGSHGGLGSSASSWGTGASSPGSLFDGSGVNPTDPTAGFASDTGFSDPFGSGGATKDDAGGGFDTQSSWDSSGGGFDSGGGGFDGGGGSFDSGGGGFDDNT